jgi:hypothetical protein
MSPHIVENAFIKITGNSGYSRHGDFISLDVDRIDNLNNSGLTTGSLALQLWACQKPYDGGSLTGWKLAELMLGILESNHFIGPVKSSVPAYFPEHGDYAIVLVISEWDGEDFNLIHDFHNYPYRDVFLHPRLEGLLSYHWTTEGRLGVDVERIYNPRGPDNVSGTISLELWALTEPYVMGDFSGHAVTGINLGILPGGVSLRKCSYKLDISSPPPGTYTLVLMLREWTSNGYVTRDHFDFNSRETFPLAIQALPSDKIVNTNNAPEAVQNPVQSPDAVTTTESGSPSPTDAEQAAIVRKTANKSVSVRIAEFISFAQRVLKI